MRSGIAQGAQSLPDRLVHTSMIEATSNSRDCAWISEKQKTPHAITRTASCFISSSSNSRPFKRYRNILTFPHYFSRKNNLTFLSLHSNVHNASNISE